MRVRPTNNDKEGNNNMMDKAAETYRWWNNLATLNKEDSIGLSLLKIGVRVLGILILIALSPVVLITLIITFMAAL